MLFVSIVVFMEINKKHYFWSGARSSEVEYVDGWRDRCNLSTCIQLIHIV